MADFQFPELEDRTLPTILAHWAENAGDREYLQFGENPASTFLEVEIATNRVAHSLAALGLTRGNRVAILAPNCLELVQTWFAAAKLGAVEVPVNIALRGKLLAHVLGNSGARILVVHASLLADVRDVVNSLPAISTVVVVGGSPEDARTAGITADRLLAFPELLEGSSDSLTGRPSYSDPMAILYTSGTTGPAKGAVMPHHQYYVWVELYARSLGLTSDDSYFTPLPLFHADGQLWGAYFPLVFGTKGTFEEKFSVSRFWEQAKRSGATATNMLGAMVHMLWKQEPSPADRDHRLRVAQAIPMIPLKESFQERFGLQLVTGYGQTETNWVSYDTETDFRDGSCGKVPSEFFEVAIVDELDEPVPAGQIGEIVVRPKLPWSISLGYHGNPEATQQTWKNLWFHSGDAGRLDEDGWLYFSDRIKDVIRRRGSNISAFELESVVDEHPDVLESAAFAVPSELSEDDVMVVAVTSPQSTLEPCELHAYCVENLPKFMVPRYLELTSERLPRTPTEKISKPELRQRGITTSTWDAGDR